MPYSIARHRAGADVEEQLALLVNALYGAVRTTSPTDRFDYRGLNTVIELKSRNARYKPTDFSTWLIPVKKIESWLLEKDKILILLYYWSSTKQLYVHKWSPNSNYPVKMCWSEQSINYGIPSDHWELLPLDIDRQLS